MILPLAPAAQKLGVGLRRPCRGQVCGGILGAIARIAPARPATPRSTTSKTCEVGTWLHAPPVRAVKNKKMGLFKGSEQCIKRIFFSVRLCRARAECLRSCLAPAHFFFLNRQAFNEIIKLMYNSQFHMAQRKNAELSSRRSGVRALDQTNFV
jgi:hypothetical protein